MENNYSVYIRLYRDSIGWVLYRKELSRQEAIDIVYGFNGADTSAKVLDPYGCNTVLSYCSHSQTIREMF